MPKRGDKRAPSHISSSLAENWVPVGPSTPQSRYPMLRPGSGHLAGVGGVGGGGGVAAAGQLEQAACIILLRTGGHVPALPTQRPASKALGEWVCPGSPGLGGWGW